MWNRLEQRELKRVSRRISDYGPGQLPAPDQPAGTDLLPQIKHIVVLMMENHSYDNYLGMLPGRGEGFPLGPDGEPEVSNTGAAGRVGPRAPPGQHGPAGGDAVAELARHPPAVGGRQARRVRQRDPAADARQGRHPGHGLLDRADLPFYYGLARTFPLADRWFSSCLGPTFPNRRFLISGTANGLIDDLPMNMADYPAARDHLRPAQQARHLVGELPPAGRGQDRAPVGAAAPAPDAPAPAALAAGAEPDLAGPAGQGHAVHRGHLPARHRPLHAARARHGAVLHRRRPGHAARGQHRGPRLQGLLRGEPAGHPEGRELRLGGHQAGHARQGLGQHPADLALRRARRLLRPRPAAARGGTGRRAGPQRVQPPDLDPRGHGGAVPGLREERPEAGRRAEALRPLRLPGPRGPGLAVRPAAAT